MRNTRSELRPLGILRMIFEFCYAECFMQGTRYGGIFSLLESWNPFRSLGTESVPKQIVRRDYAE